MLASGNELVFWILVPVSRLGLRKCSSNYWMSAKFLP